MKIRTEHVLVLGIPGSLVLGLALAYVAGVLVGVDRELALDSTTMVLPLLVVATLRGIRRSGRSTWWPMQLGGLLTVAVAAAALALRAISLVSRPGPLFFFAALSSMALGFVGHRILRRLGKREPREFV